MISIKDVWLTALVLAVLDIAFWVIFGGPSPRLGLILAFAFACMGTAQFRTALKRETPPNGFP